MAIRNYEKRFLEKSREAWPSKERTGKGLSGRDGLSRLPPSPTVEEVLTVLDIG